jgi:hypothetical protein
VTLGSGNVLLEFWFPEKWVGSRPRAYSLKKEISDELELERRESMSVDDSGWSRRRGRGAAWLLVGVLLAAAWTSTPASAQRPPRPSTILIRAAGSKRIELGPFDDGRLQVVAFLRVPERSLGELPEGPDDDEGLSQEVETFRKLVTSLCKQREGSIDGSLVLLEEELPELATPEKEVKGLRVLTGLAKDNEDLAREWLVGERAGLWLLGPRGEVLGAYDWEQRDLAGARLAECLTTWQPVKVEHLWGRIEHAGSSWRHALDLVVGKDWRAERDTLLTTLDRARDAHRDVWRNEVRRGATEEVAVRLAAQILLHRAVEEEVPQELLDWIGEKRTRKSSPELEVLGDWLAFERGEFDEKRLARELFPSDAEDRQAALVALYRMRLRSPVLSGLTRDVLLRASSRHWELRSMAARVLAEASSPGVGAPASPELDLEVLRGLAGDEAWQVRLAFAELVGGRPERAATVVMVDALASEPHPLVVEGLVSALRRSTGANYGAQATAWQRFLERQPEDWSPVPRPLHEWSPPQASLVSVSDAEFWSDGRGERGTFSVEGIFDTELSRVLYVLDASESMEWGLDEEVVRQLEAQCEGFDGEDAIGIVAFSEFASTLGTSENRPKLQSATPRTCAKLIESYAGREKSKKTDFGAALTAAFEYEGFDEVVLLSDGVPSIGLMQSEVELVALLDHLNLVRRARVSTVLISIGKSYIYEDLGSLDMPLPTDEEREAWHRQQTPWLRNSQPYQLLQALARPYGGSCRIGFGTKLYSRNGVPSND